MLRSFAHGETCSVELCGAVALRRHVLGGDDYVLRSLGLIRLKRERSVLEVYSSAEVIVREPLESDAEMLSRKAVGASLHLEPSQRCSRSLHVPVVYREERICVSLGRCWDAPGTNRITIHAKLTLPTQEELRGARSPSNLFAGKLDPRSIRSILPPHWELSI